MALLRCHPPWVCFFFSFSGRGTLICDIAFLTGLEHIQEVRLASQLGSACLCLPITEIIKDSHYRSHTVPSTCNGKSFTEWAILTVQQPDI